MRCVFCGAMTELDRKDDKALCWVCKECAGEMAEVSHTEASMRALGLVRGEGDFGARRYWSGMNDDFKESKPWTLCPAGVLFVAASKEL